MLNIKISTTLTIVLGILLLLLLVLIKLMALLPRKDVYLFCINLSYKCYQHLFPRQQCLPVYICVFSTGAKFAAGPGRVEVYSLP